ncbi:MAG: glycosyltransferase family 4 protein [Caulobacterales bacterium]
MDGSLSQPLQKLRILHVLNHCERGHGNAHVAVDLACEQTKRGHAVGYVSAGGWLEDVLLANNVQLIHLDQTTARLRRAPAMVAQLCKIIDEFKPDIVHAHMMGAAVIGFAATRIKGVPFITHIHNSFDFHSLLMRLGDRIIAVSEAVARQSIARGMPKSKIRVVLNGTTGTARLAEPPPPPMDLQRPCIGTVAGLHPRKGIDTLISAFEQVFQARPDVHLYIAGVGPYGEAYENQAKASAAAANIHFLGFVMDPRPYLASFDVFALPSLADPFALVVLEARWAGCAIVVSDVDGMPEAVDHGKAGRLIPPGNPDALATTMLDVLRSPESLAQAKRAARTGAEHFSVGRVADDTEQVYRELISSIGYAAAQTELKSSAPT